MMVAIALTGEAVILIPDRRFGAFCDTLDWNALGIPSPVVQRTPKAGMISAGWLTCADGSLWAVEALDTPTPTVHRILRGSDLKEVQHRPNDHTP